MPNLCPVLWLSWVIMPVMCFRQSCFQILPADVLTSLHSTRSCYLCDFCLYLNQQSRPTLIEKFGAKNQIRSNLISTTLNMSQDPRRNVLGSSKMFSSRCHSYASQNDWSAVSTLTNWQFNHFQTLKHNQSILWLIPTHNWSILWLYPCAHSNFR